MIKLEKKIGEKYTFYGQVTSINKGGNFYNINLKLTNKKDINIKLLNAEKSPVMNKLYQFNVICEIKEEELIFVNKEFFLAEQVLPMDKLYTLFNHFYECSKENFAVIEKNIEIFLNKIQNPIIAQITKNLYEKNKKSFLIHPAAFKMHHNYFGGLSNHTLNILKMVDIFVKLFPFLRKDFLYAGIILHDMAKINEINNLTKKYTKEGLLLGHLIMMNNNITEEAIKLNYQQKEEILILKHIIISHHGLLNFGAIQKPKIGEALLIWYLDTIDSQLNTLSEYLEKTEKGEFTEAIPVLNRSSFYKPKI